MKTSPSQGGCWFCCEEDDRGMNFSREFDTYFHPECLTNLIPNEVQSLKKTGFVDMEVELIAREFGLWPEELDNA